jgi:hypothetical protein
MASGHVAAIMKISILRLAAAVPLGTAAFQV